MKLNKEWNLDHPTPKNTTVEKRINWHKEQAKDCVFRDIPETLKEEMEKREIL